MLGMVLGFDQAGKVILSSQKAREELGFCAADQITIEQIFPVFSGRNMEQIAASLGVAGREYPAYRQNQTCFFAWIQMVSFTREEMRYAARIENLNHSKQLEREMEQTEQKLQKVLKTKNQLVANTTHELRTPLNGIMGQVDYVLHSTGLDEEQQKALQIVMRCCQTMEQIINDLLDFSKMEVGKIQLEKHPFSIRETIEQVIDTNSKQANTKGICLQAHVADAIPDILYGDGMRLGQILNNLVSNGVKFTSFGSVRVEMTEISHTGNRMEMFFLVMDTGIGIAAEDRDKLFKDFSQVDGSITRKYGGTGLGLAITKRLVTMMGGTIHVESELGKGSTFAFTVVLYTDDQPETIKEAERKLDFTQLISQRVKVDQGELYQWNSQKNRAELENTMEKLVLSIEVRNWERTEIFATKIKELSIGAGQEILKQIFRMELFLRREDHDKSLEAFEQLQEIIITKQ